jgi:hypothetical protein
VESHTGALYLDKPAEVARYDEAWRGIWSSALDEAASVDLIRQAVREFRQ